MQVAGSTTKNMGGRQKVIRTVGTLLAFNWAITTGSMTGGDLRANTMGELLVGGGKKPAYAGGGPNPAKNNTTGAFMQKAHNFVHKEGRSNDGSGAMDSAAMGQNAVMKRVLGKRTSALIGAGGAATESFNVAKRLKSWIHTHIYINFYSSSSSSYYHCQCYHKKT